MVESNEFELVKVLAKSHVIRLLRFVHRTVVPLCLQTLQVRRG